MTGAETESVLAGTSENLTRTAIRSTIVMERGRSMTMVKWILVSCTDPGQGNREVMNGRGCLNGTKARDTHFLPRMFRKPVIVFWEFFTSWCFAWFPMYCN